MGLVAFDIRAQRLRARETITAWSGVASAGSVTLTIGRLRHDLAGVGLGSEWWRDLECAMLRADKVRAFRMLDAVGDQRLRPWAQAARVGWLWAVGAAAVSAALVVGTWAAVGCVDMVECVRRARVRDEAHRCVGVRRRGLEHDR